MPAPAPKAFLDANVLVSASLSRTGSAYQLLHFVQLGMLVGHTSTTVVEEAERATGRFVPPALSELRRLLGRMRVHVHPGVKSTASVTGLADAKDLHVVAAAVRAKAMFLVTFNLRDFRGREIRERFGITVVRPDTMLRIVAQTTST